MTELMRRDELGAVAPLNFTDTRTEGLVAWAQAARAAHELATPLCSTSFVPAHFQNKPGDATAAILFGAEAGLSPLQALQGIYVISGKPAMYARTLMAVVLGAGHEVWTETLTDSRAVVCGRRRGSSNVERVEWTIDRAKRAGYTKNAKYQTDPQSMLLARAQSDICRRLAPDAILGMAYSVEELQDEDVPTTTVTRSATKRTVKRAEPPVPVEPEFDDTPAPPTGGVNGNDSPPMVGNDDPEPPAEPSQPPGPAETSAAGGSTTPGAITQAQLRMLHALLREAGINDRDLGLAFCADVIGREVDSTKSLTKVEATRIIDRLNEMTAPSEDTPHPDEFFEAEVVDD